MGNDKYEPFVPSSPIFESCWLSQGGLQQVQHTQRHAIKIHETPSTDGAFRTKPDVRGEATCFHLTPNSNA